MGSSWQQFSGIFNIHLSSMLCHCIARIPMVTIIINISGLLNVPYMYMGYIGLWRYWKAAIYWQKKMAAVLIRDLKLSKHSNSSSVFLFYILACCLAKMPVARRSNNIWKMLSIFERSSNLILLTNKSSIFGPKMLKMLMLKHSKSIECSLKLSWSTKSLRANKTI